EVRRPLRRRGANARVDEGELSDHAGGHHQELTAGELCSGRAGPDQQVGAQEQHPVPAPPSAS
ncbi:hypothetical protein, partial [Streptomyces viridosporus]|uniref:hypothetical protein n=1 Tax=Streptomyces viridosporus TaxID=67581 RepID=UPI0021004FFF